MTHDVEKNKLKDWLEPVYDILKENKCFVAGGAITSLFTMNEVNDWDIYVPSFEALMKLIVEIKGTYSVIYTNHTEKSILFFKDELKVQLIHFKFFDNAYEIFKTFDFTCCMAAYSFEKEEFIFHPDFLKANSQRRLKFSPLTDFPMVSALRVQKYVDKGYTISKAEFMKLMLTVANLSLTSWEDVKEQTGGLYGHDVDTLFGGDKEYSFEASIKALQNVYNIPKRMYNSKTTFESMVKDVIIQHKFKGEKQSPRYFKWVTKDYKSAIVTYDNSKCMIYSVGSTVNGGDMGVYALGIWDVSSRYSDPASRKIVELKLLEGAEVVDSGHELRLIGDVLVLRECTLEEFNDYNLDKYKGEQE